MIDRELGLVLANRIQEVVSVVAWDLPDHDRDEIRQEAALAMLRWYRPGGLREQLLRDPTQLGSYLWRVVMNVKRRFLSRQGRRIALFPEPDELVGESTPDPSEPRADSLTLLSLLAKDLVEGSPAYDALTSILSGTSDAMSERFANGLCHLRSHVRSLLHKDSKGPAYEELLEAVMSFRRPSGP